MNLQLMLLVGMLLGSDIPTDIAYYENMYVEQHNQNQEKMYVEQVEESPRDIEALTQLADYYRDLCIVEKYGFENFEKAEDIYKEIIELDPKSTALADFYLTIEEGTENYYVYDDKDKVEFYKNAEEEFLRLLEIDNNNTDMMINLADLYRNYYKNFITYSVIDPFTDLDYFDEAEKIYVDILSVDEDNIEVREKLIELYKINWRSSLYSQNRYDNEYFEKIEEQYLEILNINEDYIEGWYGLTNFYAETSYDNDDLDFFNKVEETYSELLKRESKEEPNAYIPLNIGRSYEYKLDNSGYTDIEAFNKAEYYYNYVLDMNIEPERTSAQSFLIRLYENNYYYGNDKESLQKLEQMYEQYPPVPDKYKGNTYFNLAELYEYEWLKDKSDYTYYYMAEDALYDAIDFQLQLASDNTYLEYNPVEIYTYLVKLYSEKYEFDGDIDSLNRGKNRLLDKIESQYNKEISYINGEVPNSYVDAYDIDKLGSLYHCVWSLDTDDMQYYDYAEKAFLVVDSQSNYSVLFELGSLYTDRWLIDKSNLEYKLKAIECFEEILYGDSIDYFPWLKEDVYLELEKLEL